jgi:rhamnose utilization protein RhaD (predicted bifunctional aldolase and dehydrogenase)
LRHAEARHFVRVRRADLLAMLDAGPVPDDAVLACLRGAQVEAEGPRPSTEAFLHAACLELPGVSVVAHTHPTAVNAFTCAREFERVVRLRVFPDHIVLCGPAPAVVPYVDPGLPLARAVREHVQAFVAAHGSPPREVFLQNHGYLALGDSPRRVLDTTRMAIKAARIMAGTTAFGGPQGLPPEHIARIHGREDEHYRQRVIEGR